MIALDTTVLVYAKGADHELREPCRQIVTAVAAGTLRATTTVEVIQELAHVRARRHGRSDAAALARDYAELLAPLLPVERGSLERGLALFAATQGIGALDAVLAAAAIDREATHLLSADRGFAAIDGIEHVFPDAAGVEGLLS